MVRFEYPSIEVASGSEVACRKLRGQIGNNHIWCVRMLVPSTEKSSLPTKAFETSVHELIGSYHSCVSLPKL